MLIEGKFYQRQKSHQMVKHLVCPPYKILGKILKMDKGGTQTNGPEDKKIDDDTQGLTSERWLRLRVKKRR